MRRLSKDRLDRPTDGAKKAWARKGAGEGLLGANLDGFDDLAAGPLEEEPFFHAFRQ